MTDWHVVDHHLDEAATELVPGEEGDLLTPVPAAVYRLTVGHVVEREVAVTDGDGNPIFNSTEARDEEGELITDLEGEPLMTVTPITETVKELVPVEDFVFAADDERWAGKPPEEVAKLQRREVKKALALRDQQALDAAAAASSRTALPGTGKAL